MSTRAGASAATSRWGRLAPRLAPLLVLVCALVPFLPALGAEFVTWDDNRNFLANSAYRGLGWAELRWMWTTTHMGHYIPLTWMTLGLDYVLWGMDASGYHLQNMLWHGAAAVLTYFVALRVYGLVEPASVDAAYDPAARVPVAGTARIGAAAIAALAFAVHPLRVESVAWVTERRDMLSLAFYLASVLCYLRFIADGRRPRWYAGSLALFVAALLAKATAVTLPAALLVLNVWPLRRIGGPPRSAASRVVGELVPFVALALLAGVASVRVLHPPAQLDAAAKLAVSAYSLAFYLWKTAVPTGLAPLYEMPGVVDPLATRYLVGYVMFATITAAAWVTRKRSPGLTAAWVAYLLVMLPMLGVIQNGPQIAADRYTYHAAPIVALLAGAAWARWRERRPVVRIGVPAMVLAVLAIATWDQTGYWRDSERLWGRVLEVDPRSSIAQIAMGDLLIAQGRTAEAADHYARGVELDPDYAEGHNNLGVALAREGRSSEAMAHYRAAIALDSGYTDAYSNLGIALSREGDHAGAIAQYERAIALRPANADALVNYGNALLRLGRPADALARYEAADRVRPRHGDTHLNWGVALAQLGRIPEATQHFRLALEADPGNTDARAYLARVEGDQAAARAR